MILANNGILIVALTMALGMHLNDKWMLLAAFVMAGLSYLTTLHDALMMQPENRLLSNLLFTLTFAAGVATYVLVALRLL